MIPRLPTKFHPNGATRSEFMTSYRDIATVKSQATFGRKSAIGCVFTNGSHL